MENNNYNKKEKFAWPAFTIICYIISFIFICIGFYKMMSYNNGEIGDLINSYVGGDAYNYIINANYSTAYFVLALIFVALGSTVVIVKAITSSTSGTSVCNSNTDNNSINSELPPL